MEGKYYTLPFSFKTFTDGLKHKKCNLKESIAQHLHLIATTSLGECKFDSTYGCSIWEIDFENAISDNQLRETLKNSLTHSIRKYEPRIKGVEIVVEITQFELARTDGNLRIKKRIDISINAELVKTNEPIRYFEYFFLGPLSYY